jgi:putative flippase GtrA
VRQFSKFAVVGVLNTITSYSVYGISTRWLGLDPLIANVVAFAVAVTVSYVLNKTWTFRDPARVSVNQYSRFVGISAGGFAISEVSILVLHHALGVHDLIAFSVGVGAAMFWNFFANRRWTFARQQPE